MACLVHHWNAQPTSPGSCSSLIWAWFHLHSEVEMNWHVDLLQTAVKVFHVILICITLDVINSCTQPRTLHFMQLELNSTADAPYNIFLGSTLRIIEMHQVGSALFPYEVHDLSMVLTKPVSEFSGRWSQTLHRCAIYVIFWLSAQAKMPFQGDAPEGSDTF